MFILNIYIVHLTYPLESLHIPPVVHVPPFENHSSRTYVHNFPVKDYLQFP